MCSDYALTTYRNPHMREVEKRKRLLYSARTGTSESNMRGEYDSLLLSSGMATLAWSNLHQVLNASWEISKSSLVPWNYFHSPLCQVRSSSD